MNYEELLAARNDGKKHPVMLPIGGFYREQVDGKWRLQRPCRRSVSGIRR